MSKQKSKTDPFKESIQNYLNGVAEKDELFAQTLKKKNKNIDDCINYIYSEVKSSGRQGFNDDEIFGMAVHYFDEDDIKPGTKVTGKVIVNHSVDLSEDDKSLAKEKAIELAAAELKEEAKQGLHVELTEEDRAAARQIAIDRAVEEEKERLKKKTSKKVQPAAEEAPTLF